MKIFFHPNCPDGYRELILKISVPPPPTSLCGVSCARMIVEDRIVAEIVSSGSHRMDYFTKLFKYRSAGVREYWVVDPDKNKITV